MEGYDVAQICINGHEIASTAGSSPEFRKPFCPQCGARTIMACEGCGSAIQGHYHVPGFIGGLHYTPPAYCYNCGSPFPWTAARMAVAHELADEAEGLSDEERTKLKDGLEDISRDGPRTEAAASRIGRIMAKVRGPTGVALQKVVTEVATEAAKKIILGGM